MTYDEARAILAGTLRFGDEQQIAAKQFLTAVDIARETITHCKRCYGTGVNRRGKHCAYCAAKFPDDIRAAVGVSTDEGLVARIARIIVNSGQ